MMKLFNFSGEMFSKLYFLSASPLTFNAVYFTILAEIDQQEKIKCSRNIFLKIFLTRRNHSLSNASKRWEKTDRQFKKIQTYEFTVIYQALKSSTKRKI